MRRRPLVGLLHNPAVPVVVAAAPSLVECLEVIPDRLWHDLGAAAGRDRFILAEEPIALLRRTLGDRPLSGHGLGLSLPSDLPVDEAMLDQVAVLARRLGFAWYSEHLSVFLTPRGAVPGAQAGLGLPVTCGGELMAVLAPKLARLRAAIGDVPLAMENAANFAEVPDAEESEPAFFSRLHAGGHCDTLLDLHNLHVTERNGGTPAEAWLAALDPAAVTEIHLAGGDEMGGFYSDSHCGPTPDAVWDLAVRWAPRFPNLRAIVFEFHETWFPEIGLPGLIAELERMHRLADACVREVAHAG
jgi:uncharacterized protein (UPF0276 family)